MAGKQVEFIAGNGIDLSGNASNKSVTIAAKTATETTPGLTQLATAAEVQGPVAGVKKVLTVDRVPDIFNSKTYGGEIFAAFGTYMLGMNTAWITNANVATAQTPLYELYGITGDQGYSVETSGQMLTNTHIRQIATVTAPTAHARRRFIRTTGNAGGTPVWSKWKELPTLSYSSGVVTLIVDGENGNDATANATEARPFKTLQAAIAAAPKITLGWQTWIRIKAGTYEIGASEFAIEEFMGGQIQMSSYSGDRDVEIVFNDGAGQARGLLCTRVPAIQLSNIRFLKGVGTKIHIGLWLQALSYVLVNNCEFENFATAINCGYALCVVNNCNYINCNQAIWTSNGGVMMHGMGTATGTGYILTVSGGIIIKSGTQPAGTIATERVIAGQII